MDRRQTLLALVVLLVLAAAVAGLFPDGCQKRPTTEEAAGGANNTYLFCFWNAENFFDDNNDGRHAAGDKVYDPWFAENPDILKLKLSKLTEVLLKMKDGKGPDIIALVEVETPRAAELLKDALNEKLGDPSLYYKYLLCKEVHVGRHICPAVISRLPAERAKLHGRGMRILEVHVNVRDQDLVVLVSHWTSRVSDHTGEMREKYGDQIYGTFKAMYKSNPKVDFLVCGDFNDTPTDASVRDHLHAVGDKEAVLNAVEEPLLFNLLAAAADKGLGSHFDRGRWYLFDQIAISRGMLDGEGWSCDPQTATVVPTPPRPGDRHSPHPPWKFGGPRDKAARGYSDHFPVTVELTLHAP
jgi:endonuclease/exonuclease/phosphatase family metal-dependent hydrolase